MSAFLINCFEVYKERETFFGKDYGYNTKLKAMWNGVMSAVSAKLPHG